MNTLRSVLCALGVLATLASGCASTPARQAWSSGAGPRPTTPLEYNNWLTDMTGQLSSEAGAWAESFQQAMQTNDFSVLKPHRMRMESTLDRAEADVAALAPIGRGGEGFRDAFSAYLGIVRSTVQALVPAESLTASGVPAYGQQLQGALALEASALDLMKQRQREFAQLNGFEIAQE